MKSLEELCGLETYTKEEVSMILEHLYNKVDMSAKYRIFDLIEDLEFPEID